MANKSIKDRLANEKDVEFNPSAWSQTGLVLGFILSIPAISMVSYSAPSTVLSFQIMNLGFIDLGFNIPMLATVPLFFACTIVWRKYDVRYVIGKDKLAIVKGLFSNTKQIDEISFEHIKSFQVNQTLIQRFFHVGDLEIGRESNIRGVVSVAGIRHPGRLQFMIERRKLLSELAKRVGQTADDNSQEIRRAANDA